MTNKELHKLIEEFISKQNDIDKDEWYCTEKKIAEIIFRNFKDFLKNVCKKRI